MAFVVIERRFLESVFAEDLGHCAREITIQHGGMDVAFAADSAGVSEAGSDAVDGFDNVFLCLGLGGERFKIAQGSAGEHGAGPGAEVFRGEFVAAYLTQIIIHIGRVDGVMSLAVFVLEQFVAGDVLTLANNFC